MKRIILRTGVAASTLCLLAFSAVQAATVDIVRLDTDARESVHGIRDNTGTYGSDLIGAQITANYADGSSENMTWWSNPQTFTEPNGYTYTTIDGYANGDNIDMMLLWDGFEVTTTSLLTSLSINLLPAGVVFDTDPSLDDSPGGGSTPGTSFGFPMELYSEYASLTGSVTATYTGIVNLFGAPAAGDLFTTMTVDFSNLSAGGILGDIAFRSDMDAMRYTDDLSPVPLPSSLSLLLLGLGGLGLRRHASRRRAA